MHRNENQSYHFVKKTENRMSLHVEELGLDICPVYSITREHHKEVIHHQAINENQTHKQMQKNRPKDKEYLTPSTTNLHFFQNRIL